MRLNLSAIGFGHDTMGSIGEVDPPRNRSRKPGACRIISSYRTSGQEDAIFRSDPSLTSAATLRGASDTHDGDTLHSVCSLRAATTGADFPHFITSVHSISSKQRQRQRRDDDDDDDDDGDRRRRARGKQKARPRAMKAREIMRFQQELKKFLNNNVTEADHDNMFQFTETIYIRLKIDLSNTDELLQFPRWTYLRMCLYQRLRFPVVRLYKKLTKEKMNRPRSILSFIQRRMGYCLDRTSAMYADFIAENGAIEPEIEDVTYSSQDPPKKDVDDGGAAAAALALPSGGIEPDILDLFFEHLQESERMPKTRAHQSDKFNEFKIELRKAMIKAMEEFDNDELTSTPKEQLQKDSIFAQSLMDTQRRSRRNQGRSATGNDPGLNGPYWNRAKQSLSGSNDAAPALAGPASEAMESTGAPPPDALIRPTSPPLEEMEEERQQEAEYETDKVMTLYSAGPVDGENAEMQIENDEEREEYAEGVLFSTPSAESSSPDVEVTVEDD